LFWNEFHRIGLLHFAGFSTSEKERRADDLRLPSLTACDTLAQGESEW
jgi:hypothetical protein